PAIRPIWESGEAFFRRFNIRCYCESGCRYVTMYRKVCNSSVKNGRAAGIYRQAARMEAEKTGNKKMKRTSKTEEVPEGSGEARSDSKAGHPLSRRKNVLRGAAFIVCVLFL